MRILAVSQGIIEGEGDEWDNWDTGVAGADRPFRLDRETGAILD